jgi:hypothetical protein
LKIIIGATAIALLAGIGTAQAQNTAPRSTDQPGVGQKSPSTTGETPRTARNAPTQGSTGPAGSVSGDNNKSKEGGQQGGSGNVYTSPNNPAPKGIQR